MYNCPNCKDTGFATEKTRKTTPGAIIKRKVCKSCGFAFFTEERIVDDKDNVIENTTVINRRLNQLFVKMDNIEAINKEVNEILAELKILVFDVGGVGKC